MWIHTAGVQLTITLYSLICSSVTLFIGNTSWLFISADERVSKPNDFNPKSMALDAPPVPNIKAFFMTWLQHWFNAFGKANYIAIVTFQIWLFAFVCHSDNINSTNGSGLWTDGIKITYHFSL